MTKKCRTCGLELPESDFESRRLDCKTCYRRLKRNRLRKIWDDPEIRKAYVAKLKTAISELETLGQDARLATIAKQMDYSIEKLAPLINLLLKSGELYINIRTLNDQRARAYSFNPVNATIDINEHTQAQILGAMNKLLKANHAPSVDMIRRRSRLSTGIVSQYIKHMLNTGEVIEMTDPFGDRLDIPCYTTREDVATTATTLSRMNMFGLGMIGRVA